MKKPTKRKKPVLTFPKDSWSKQETVKLVDDLRVQVQRELKELWLRIHKMEQESYFGRIGRATIEQALK